MSRVRSVLATLLLCGFAVLGVFLLVVSLILLGLDSDPFSTLGSVVDAFGALTLVTGMVLTLPSAAALLLIHRRPIAAGAVASMLGLGVFAATASQATSDGVLLMVNLAGLALLLCALPLPVARIDGERS